MPNYKSRKKSGSKKRLIALIFILLVIPLTIWLVLNQQNYLNFASEIDTSVNRVFITSTTHSGYELNGLSGADAKCQEIAESSNLGGTWKAWLSDMTISATSRLDHSTNPYQRIDGINIANNWDDLTDGSLLNPLNITELGTTNNNSHVWTNSNSDGNITQADEQGSCASWISGNYGASTGDSSRIDGGWTDFGAISCGNPRPLYCFEQKEINDPETEVEEEPEAGGFEETETEEPKIEEKETVAEEAKTTPVGTYQEEVNYEDEISDKTISPIGEGAPVGANVSEDYSGKSGSELNKNVKQITPFIIILGITAIIIGFIVLKKRKK